MSLDSAAEPSTEQSVGSSGEESFEETRNDNQIIASILRLIALSSSDSSISDVAEYKKQIKALLEQLLTKFEDDLEYQNTLEEQVSALEGIITAKNKEMRELSERTIDDIEDCKLQTEEMSSQMMSVVSTEVHKRVSLEQVLLRLQRQNFKLRNSNSRAEGGGNSGEQGDGGTLLVNELKSEVGYLNHQLAALAEENTSLRMQRKEELLRLQGIGRSIDSFIDTVLEGPNST